MTKQNQINPTDDDARALAKNLLGSARFGALAVTDPTSLTPYVARVASIADHNAALVLISMLSLHTQALRVSPDCSLLIGEPAAKGDPLTYPRMSMMCRAEQVDKALHKESWLSAIPKAKLYFDFTDFIMFRLNPHTVHLNGGFGKAYILGRDDLI